MKFLKDLRILFIRNVKGSLRNPVWLFIGFFQPIIYLLLFVPLLSNLSMVPCFPKGGAYTVFTPGLLVMFALFGAAYSGFRLVERLLVTPTRRLAILLAYVLRDIAVLLIQSGIVVEHRSTFCV